MVAEPGSDTVLVGSVLVRGMRTTTHEGSWTDDRVSFHPVKCLEGKVFLLVVLRLYSVQNSLTHSISSMESTL